MAGEAIGVGEVFGIIGKGIDAHTSARAREENYMYNEKAADNADTRTRNLYHDLYSPEAKMQQLKEAGLSPSLLASGIAGGEGHVAPQGAGAAGVGGTSGGLNTYGIQNDIRAAAEARKLNVEADILEGKNPRGEAELRDILANVGLKESQQSLNKTLDEIQKIQQYVQEQTIDANIDTIEASAERAKHEAQNAFYQANISKQEFEFNQETWDERVKKFANENAKIIAETGLTESMKYKTDAEKEAITAGIEQREKEIYIKWVEAGIHDRSQRAQEKWFKEQAEALLADQGLRKEEINNKKWEIAMNTITDILQTVATTAAVILKVSKAGK